MADVFYPEREPPELPFVRTQAPGWGVVFVEHDMARPDQARFAWWATCPKCDVGVESGQPGDLLRRIAAHECAPDPERDGMEDWP